MYTVAPGGAVSIFTGYLPLASRGWVCAAAGPASATTAKASANSTQRRSQVVDTVEDFITLWLPCMRRRTYQIWDDARTRGAQFDAAASAVFNAVGDRVTTHTMPANGDKVAVAISTI